MPGRKVPHALSATLARLPAFEGAPVRVFWQASLRVSRRKLHAGYGPGTEVHAAGFLRRRELVLDSALRRNPAELARILTHELFHFVWLRAANTLRRSWEDLLRSEFSRRARGELGWSAEWRKDELTPRDPSCRSRRWREYACESFCDTAAWLYSGVRRHDEYTLAPRWRARREAWFRELLRAKNGALPF